MELRSQPYQNKNKKKKKGKKKGSRKEKQQVQRPCGISEGQKGSLDGRGERGDEVKEITVEAVGARRECGRGI